MFQVTWFLEKTTGNMSQKYFPFEIFPVSARQFTIQLLLTLPEMTIKLSTNTIHKKTITYMFLLMPNSSLNSVKTKTQ